jgi:hypothetical protein
MATQNKCKCLDCKFNTDGNCTASTINLDYGPEGGCECLTYQPVAQKSSGKGPSTTTPEQKASVLYGGDG